MEEQDVRPGSQTKRLSWLPSVMLFGGLIVVALLLFPQHGRLLWAGWGSCVLGFAVAKTLGGFLPGPDQAMNRALLETMVRPFFPLMACVAATVGLARSEAKVFAIGLVAFFLAMLMIDRTLWLMNLSRGRSLHPRT